MSSIQIFLILLAINLIERMQRLEVPKKVMFDEKFRVIDEMAKSPARSPSKVRSIQTVQTGVTEIKSILSSFSHHIISIKHREL